MKKLAVIEAIIILFLILAISLKKPASTNTPNAVATDAIATRNKAFFDAQAARIKAEHDCNAKLLEQWVSEHQK